MEFPTRLFIGGHWTDADAGGVFEVTDPATGEVVGKVADGGSADILRAVEAAAAAQPAWGRSVALDRSTVLRRAASLMQDRIEPLARLMTVEEGKPVAQSVAEIQYGISFLEWFAEEARRSYGMTIPSNSPAKRITVLKQPAGVSAAITPWNFPSLQILRKLGAALAAGCTMVVKPSELTPLSALEIGRCFADAGLPAGVLSVVPGLDPVALAQPLLDDARVRVLSFTGSTEVGKILMRGAAATMKRLSLELGGHAPFIVFADADLDRAADEIVLCKLRNMGQTCVAANRIFVEDSVGDQLAERLVERFGSQTVGHGLDPGVTVGPLVEAAVIDKVERHVADAVDRGAGVLVGGSRSGAPALGAGHFFEPTVLDGVDEDMLVCREETFGPVAPLLRFVDEDEVIERANATPYGLAAYFFTGDLNRSIRVSEALEYGTVGVNDGSISAVQAPFGGCKESGLGREGGPVGVEEYLETKYVSLGGL